MSDRVERLSRRRRRILTVFAVTFMAWQASTIASFGDVVGSHARLVDMARIAAFAVWAAALVALLVLFPRRTGDADVDAALNDELTQANRRRAFVTGYWGALIAAAFLFGLSLFVEFTAAEGLGIVIAVAVSAPLIRFVALEKPSRDA